LFEINKYKHACPCKHAYIITGLLGWKFTEHLTLNVIVWPALIFSGVTIRGSMVRFPAGARNFSLLHRVQNDSGAHPASYSMGTRCSFPGGKAAGACEADHSPTSSAEVKNAWRYTSTTCNPPILLHGVMLS
jgi:hypothetical protein